jgi:hypothetical protein
MDSEEDWAPAVPVEYLGGGEAGPASGKRLSEREPGLGGTPEAKESRLAQSATYADAAADIGLQLRYWQSPQRDENPYRPDPKSDSDCDSEENYGWGTD